MKRLSLACTALVLSGVLSGTVYTRPARAGELVSPWNTTSTDTSSRIVAGVASGRSIAAVEIKLADGWKTYWRFPGDAGGVPPVFDWSKSDNVARVTMLYPAPLRLSDKAGDTLGYKTLVAFPALVEATDASKPVALKLTLEYGICKDVCVPVEADLMLDIPAGTTSALPASAAAALDRIPRTAKDIRPADPKVTRTEVKLAGAAPMIAIEAEFPGGTADAEVFIEAPAGSYIPLPKAGSGKDLGQNRLRFEIDLTGATDTADLKGKIATVTLVSKQGLSETTFALD